MQTQPQFGLIRRVLFPYSGEEPLTRQQSLRVIAIWAIVFTFPVILCTLTAIFMAQPPFVRALLLLIGALLFGIIIFGVTAWACISVINRTARLRQQQQNARRTNSTSGGRYGS
ncbi:hypothetical protein EPA93_30345 [Ktedonosporobacter rubrisoli]|uniref:Uncharacterized protein n=1 Tax=Ktedonosporobacter rubrisoli TaxID=2509675 RepID=A0A4P6JXA4_KTERU|nr:hypothetical protein [Ktedonosporobacter rubrisoli]QBD80052.1 hypothetical protein EPA93_30345 [Ktedonosporobacter rubrisoli]